MPFILNDYDMPNAILSPAQLKDYHRDGFLILKNFCSAKEVEKLYSVAVEDSAMGKNAIDVNDKSGKKSKLSLWFTPGNDVFGYLTRSRKMIGPVAQLLDSEAPVCHFHSKLMQKEPRVGGAWEWHQDYGYWYKNQFLFPEQLVSVMVALTEANKANGCLQVIKGSHKMGRLNHGFAGEQVGADMTMVNHALETMEHIYVELEAGDALFFHINILHRSEANTSDKPRWSLISCYNSLSNPAYNDESASWKEPVKILPDDALMNVNAGSANTAGDFLKKEK